MFSSDKKRSTESPPTEEPPTPSPEMLKNTIICIEYNDNNDEPNEGQTYKLDSTTTPISKPNENMITTIETTVESIKVTTTEPEGQTTSQSGDQTTPYDPNGRPKDKIPVIIGIEQKAKNENKDPTVVKAV